MAEAEPETPPAPPSMMERTVFVEGLRTSVEKLAKRIKPVFTATHGENAILALVRRKDGYEITFSTTEAASECLKSGIDIDNRHYEAIGSASPDILVTLYPVSAYVEDSVLVEKLTELGCQVNGEVKRNQILGIENGRRKVVVQLPPNMRSLPRAITVKLPTGRVERIDVYHRNQRLRKATR